VLEIGNSADAFHPFPTDRPEWTEAVWFGTHVPQRALSLYVYQWFRPVLGIYGGGCIVWDRSARVPWDAPLFQYDVNRPILERLRLQDLALDNGTSISCLREGLEYAVRFQNSRASLVLNFSAVATPHLTARDGTADFFAGHLDQPGRYTGSLEIEGTRYEIDSYGIRDRSWGPRVIRDDVRLGYFHAEADHVCLLVFCHAAQAGQPVFNGYLVFDGDRQPLLKGKRETEFRDGRLAKISFELEDTAGRTISGSGTPLNEFAYMPYPNLLSRHYLMRWDIRGKIAYGEEQDLWSLPLWRAQLRTGGLA
jgi:hypothetical protein